MRSDVRQVNIDVHRGSQKSHRYLHRNSKLFSTGSCDRSTGGQVRLHGRGLGQGRPDYFSRGIGQPAVFEFQSGRLPIPWLLLWLNIWFSGQPDVTTPGIDDIRATATVQSLSAIGLPMLAIAWTLYVIVRRRPRAPTSQPAALLSTIDRTVPGLDCLRTLFHAFGRPGHPHPRAARVCKRRDGSDRRTGWRRHRWEGARKG